MRPLLALAILCSPALGEIPLTSLSGTFMGAEPIPGEPPFEFSVWHEADPSVFAIAPAQTGAAPVLFSDPASIEFGMTGLLEFQIRADFGTVGLNGLSPLDIWSDGIKGDELSPIIVDAHYSPPNGFSLAGTNLRLSRVELLIHRYDLVEPDPLPPDWDVWPALHYGIDWQVNFFAVPEPSSLVIGLCTIGLLFSCRPACNSRGTRW